MRRYSLLFRILMKVFLLYRLKRTKHLLYGILIWNRGLWSFLFRLYAIVVRITPKLCNFILFSKQFIHKVLHFLHTITPLHAAEITYTVILFLNKLMLGRLVLNFQIWFETHISLNTFHTLRRLSQFFCFQNLHVNLISNIFLDLMLILLLPCWAKIDPLGRTEQCLSLLLNQSCSQCLL